MHELERENTMQYEGKRSISNQTGKNWNRTVQKRLMKLCFFMEKVAVLQSIRWIRVESILISLWGLNRLKN